MANRQSCLANLLRKAREIGEELALIPQADSAAVRFCKNLNTLFRKACKVKIPASARMRKSLVARFQAKLDSPSQTSSLQGSDILNVFQLLFRPSPIHAHDAIFGSTDPPEK